MKKGINLKSNSLKMSPESFYKTREDPFKLRSSKAEKKKASMVLSFLKQTTPVEILDIGCGEGYFTDFYYKNLSVKKMYGCDVSSTAISRARIYKSGVRYFQCDLTRKFPEKYLINKFDTALLSEVLYYIENEKREHAVNNIQKFCKKGCNLIVCNSKELSFLEIYTLFRPYFTLSDSKKYKFFKDKNTNILHFIKK